MTRNEQEFYRNIERIAKALEEANRLKILKLSGENTSHLTVNGIKKELLEK